jgi:hypothetical protein
MKKKIGAFFVCILVFATLSPVLGSMNDIKSTHETKSSALKIIVVETLPVISIGNISGGFGVTATVINMGTKEATNIPWSIYFCSGLVFIGGLTRGTISVPAGGETTISSGLVFGFGPGSITVTAGDASKIVSCFVLGPLILGIGPYP